MSVTAAERLVLIGVEGVDWPALRGVMRRGLVPNLSALAARGGLGSLRDAGPQEGASPWATMATGHGALAHGVVRDTETWAGGLRPVTAASWQRPPLWATLVAAGVATAGIGWPAAAPGDGWAGRHVDDSYATATASDWNDWALPLHCAPAGLRAALRDLRVHPADIGAAQLLPLVPGLAAIDQARDSGLPLLAVGLARTATIQAAALHLLAEPDWQALFVHHRWLGRVRRTGAAPPPWDQVQDGAWRFLDGLLGRLVDAAGDGCTVLVASPGWQGAPGVVLAAGPGMRPASEIADARLVDIAPTVLARFGLRDAALPGRVIAGTGIAPGARAVAAPPPADAAAGDADLADVVAQGYAPLKPPPVAWQVEGLLIRAALLLADDPAAAGAAADAALALLPDRIDAVRLRARAHVMLGEAEPLPALADTLLRLAPDRPWGSLIHGAAHAMRGDTAAARPWLDAAAAAADPDTTLRVGTAWLMLKDAAEAQAAFAAVLVGDPGNVEAAVGSSVAALASNDLQAAERPLRQLLARDPQAPAAWLQLADVLQRAGRTREADGARASALRFGAEA